MRLDSFGIVPFLMKNIEINKILFIIYVKFWLISTINEDQKRLC